MRSGSSDSEEEISGAFPAGAAPFPAAPADDGLREKIAVPHRSITGQRN